MLTRFPEDDDCVLPSNSTLQWVSWGITYIMSAANLTNAKAIASANNRFFKGDDDDDKDDRTD